MDESTTTTTVIRRLGTSDVMRAHSYAGAAGWRLLDAQGLPEHACGLYVRRGQRAFMVLDRTGKWVLVAAGFDFAELIAEAVEGNTLARLKP